MTIVSSEAFSMSHLCDMIVLVAREMETLFGAKFKTLDSIIYLNTFMFTYGPSTKRMGHKSKGKKPRIYN